MPSRVLIPVLFSAVLIGCEDTFTLEDDDLNEPVDVTLSIQSDVSETAIATIRGEVTAPDLDPPVEFELDVVDGTATGEVTVLAGSDRVITLSGYDAQDVETHRGSASVTVTADSTAASVQVTLEGLMGQVPVEATVSTFSLTLNADEATVAVGGEALLTAEVVDGTGSVVEGADITWASTNPGIATVAAGAVTGASPGTATIHATYRGVVARATVTVE